MSSLKGDTANHQYFLSSVMMNFRLKRLDHTALTPCFILPLSKLLNPPHPGSRVDLNAQAEQASPVTCLLKYK